MMWMRQMMEASFLTALLLGSTAFVTGCSQKAGPAGDQAATQAEPAAVETVVDDHSGWWCAEHGVPEEECTLCSSQAAERAQAKGDWCEEHDRAESQCFICHPDLEAKFAARYEAKYGKKPPAPKK